MAMIMAEVDLVGKLETKVTRWLIERVEGGGGGRGDNASTSWRVLDGSNFERPASICEGPSERQEVRSGQQVDDGDEMAGRETRKGSAAGGGGENMKDGSGGGEL
jgi:hypothetical protein